MESGKIAEQNSLSRRAVKKVKTLFAGLENPQGGEDLDNLERGHVGQGAAESVLEEMLCDDENCDNADSMSNDETCDNINLMSHDDIAGDGADSMKNDLVSSLAGWAVNYGICLIALSALLAILQVHIPFLPKDGRTLLMTTASYRPQMIAGGHFYYFGILNSQVKFFERICSKVPDLHTFRLQLNFDGIPLFHSNSEQLWPILGILQGFKERKTFVIALFCGRSKPKSLNEYLKDLVTEMQSLSSG